MNEKLDSILEGLTAVPIKTGPLVDEQHPIHVVERCRAVSRWAKIRGDGLGLAVDRELLDLLLAYGQAGIQRIFVAYARETCRTADEAGATWLALQTLTRRARSMRLTDWCLDGLKPPTEESARPKLLVELEAGLNDRLRSAAAARGESLREFTEAALTDRLDSIVPKRRKSRRRATRAKAPGAETPAPIAIEAG